MQKRAAEALVTRGGHAKFLLLFLQDFARHSLANTVSDRRISMGSTLLTSSRRVSADFTVANLPATRLSSMFAWPPDPDMNASSKPLPHSRFCTYLRSVELNSCLTGLDITMVIPLKFDTRAKAIQPVGGAGEIARRKKLCDLV